MTSILLVALVFCLLPGAGLPALDLEVVEGLPSWENTSPRPAQTLRVGEELQWFLVANDLDSSKPGMVIEGSARVEVADGVPIRIEAQAERGRPALLVADQPFSAAEIAPFVQTGDATAATSFMPLPGRPVAFTIGEDGAASIELTPDRDGYFCVWVRLLSGAVISLEQLYEESEEAGGEEASALYQSLVGLFGSEMVGAWTGYLVQPSETEPSECVFGWVRLRVVAGPAGASGPNRGLFEQELGTEPADPQIQAAVQESLSAQGLGLRQIWSLSDKGADAAGLLPYSVAALTAMAQHPVLRAELIRHKVGFDLRGAQANELSKAFAKARPEPPGSLLPREASAVLLRMLADLKATGAVLVAADGWVVASTVFSSKALLDQESGWETLIERGVDHVLVTEPSPQASPDRFLTRRAAVPVFRDAGEQELLGWLLCDLYAGPSQLAAGAATIVGRIVHPSPIEAGDRVRLLTGCSAEKLVGTIDRWIGDLLVVEDKPIPFGLLDSIELSKGKRSHALLGGLIGFGAGAVAGGLIAAPPGPISGYNGNDWGRLLIGSAIGGVVGGGIGALIGALFCYEVWEQVPPEAFTIEH